MLGYYLEGETLLITKAVERFATKVTPLLQESQTDIDRARRWAKQQRKSKDWPWNRFLHALASNGKSAHWDYNIGPRVECGELRWSAIMRLDSAKRRTLFAEVTNPRRRKHLRGALDSIFQRMKLAGGPTGISREYGVIKSAEDAIKYWKSFPGIGDKYAREIPMGSYDPLFRDTFALDARLRALLKQNFKEQFSYNEGVDFLQKVARRLNCDCWSLDRFLYEQYDELKQTRRG